MPKSRAKLLRTHTLIMVVHTLSLERKLVSERNRQITRVLTHPCCEATYLLKGNSLSPERSGFAPDPEPPGTRQATKGNQVNELQALPVPNSGDSNYTRLTDFNSSLYDL